jgi:hypothetical protein
MSSEAAIQSGIQTAIKAMTEFADADVVVNDWSLLDQPGNNAPYVIIQTADDFDSQQDTVSPQNEYYIILTLVEIFQNWKTTLDNLCTHRQAIIDKINTTTVRSAGGLDGVRVRRVRNNGQVDYLFQNAEDTLPIYAMQEIVLEVEDY